MTIVTVYPTGFHAAKFHASRRFNDLKGWHTDKKWNELFLEELKKCPSIEGIYEFEKQKIYVKDSGKGTHTCYELGKDKMKYHDVSFESALEWTRLFKNLKIGKTSLDSQIEDCKFMTLNTELGIEHVSCAEFYDMIREKKQIRSLKAIMDADRSLLDVIANEYDNRLNMSLLRGNDDTLRTDSDRIILSYKENRIQLKVAEHIPSINRDEWNSLITLTRIISEFNKRYCMTSEWRDVEVKIQTREGKVA